MTNWSFHPQGNHMIVALKVMLTTLFWSAGIFGLFNFSEVIKEVQAVQLPFPALLAALTIATQLGGSALIITNVAHPAWLGAVGLAVFTLMTIPFGHAFWTFAEPQRTVELHGVARRGRKTAAGKRPECQRRRDRGQGRRVQGDLL
jgi:transmembrane protein